MFKRRKQEVAVFLIILAVAVFFRTYELGTLPPGLWPDEAANGVDALKALDSGDFKIFYTENNGREGLFINIQAMSIKYFGISPFSLRIVSAFMGILTVAGLYLLTRYLFDWRMAAVASFFLSVSTWHVIFSRIGFRAIMLPLVLVWAFYFLWRGLRTGRISEYLAAGIIGGIGFYTYFSYRIVPAIAAILFVSYWSYLKKDFSGSEYEHAKYMLLRGFAAVVLTVITIALPIGIYFLSHSGDFLKRDGAPISVFAQDEPLRELGKSIAGTLGMFNFSGDRNLRHNIPGWPQLSLPIGIFFAVGFIKDLAHWLRRKHGHFSVVHTFLFSWFFIMLVPGFLSTEAPHALRTIGVIPVVMIFAAKGFWWMINMIKGFHRINDPHAQTDVAAYLREKSLLLTIAIIAMLSAIGLLEYSRYFVTWASIPSLKNAFTHQYTEIASYLNGTDDSLPKFIYVNEGDVLVDEVPNNAQTIKFLTATPNKLFSKYRNIQYLRTGQLDDIRIIRTRFVLIPLADSPKLASELMTEYGLLPEKKNSFTIYSR